MNSSLAISVTGIGMASSLGTDAVTACAAARAGLSRPRPLEPFLVLDPDTGEMQPVLGHPVSFLTEGFTGVARLSRLGAMALRDLLRQGALAETDLLQTGLILTLGSGYYLSAIEAFETAEEGRPCWDGSPPPESEMVAARRAALEAGLVQRMFEQAGLPPPAQQTLLFEDQAGGALALSQAIDALTTGRARRFLVGGIDSYCEPDMLAALQGLELLKTPDNPVGVAPGEAAAFVLVDSHMTRRGRATVAAETITYATDGRHQFAPDTNTCRRLADTIARAQSYGSEPEPSIWSVGTHNGSSWSASEWGRTLSVAPRSVRDGSHFYPALSFGETGAAASLLALCFVVRAFERGFAPAPRALLWASSPRGAKSAFLVTAASSHGQH